MPSQPGQILTINAGSSSIKFALYTDNDAPLRSMYGAIERIGHGETHFKAVEVSGHPMAMGRLGQLTHPAAADWLLHWLAERVNIAAIQAVGHRVVHGMDHSAPAPVSPELLAQLHRIAPYAPHHVPHQIALIEAVAQRYPNVPQFAVFDTAFHRTMPQVARMLPIPRRYFEQGVQRYGFHGLSYAYLMQELTRLRDPAVAQGRVILAHLGNGASMAAVRDGQSVDTSMGFTPAAGLMMSTRAGDLDPGLAAHLARSENMPVNQFHAMVNFESGLLGVSETSSDMRDLLALEATDARAAEAVALFCYQAKKYLGAYTAVLGGLDTLVFSGGIGEHAPEIRARICEGLDYLGLALDPGRNAQGAAIISTDASRVRVRVMATDEDLMLARSVRYIYPGG